MRCPKKNRKFKGIGERAWTAEDDRAEKESLRESAKPERRGAGLGVVTQAAVENIAQAVVAAPESTKGEGQIEREIPEIERKNIENVALDIMENVAKNGVSAQVPRFDTHIVVDWSARGKPGPPKPAENSIWWAGARTDGSQPPELQPKYAPTRNEALRSLVKLIGDELEADRRVLAGFDFPFGYPAGVAARLTGAESALELWAWLAKQIKDESNNENNRYEAATAINNAYPGIGPCWGRPARWDYPDIPERKTERTRRESHPPERRIADQCADGAKTVWQLNGAGSVGSQVLLGLPALERLRTDPTIEDRATVWPLQSGLRFPTEWQVVIAEAYPSLLRKEIRERQNPGEILDRAQVRVTAEAFARLDAGGGLEPLFCGAPCLTPAQRQAIIAEEAWILGLGHEESLKSALASP
ncbi:MAG: hypothetical protein OXI01_23905 [Albidovulum sp.]|nr:hypothetical protein [Albidovulum sp.]